MSLQLCQHDDCLVPGLARERGEPNVAPGLTRVSLTKVAAVYLAIIGTCYLVREFMNVLRRYLVEDTCTRVDKDVYVRVVSHLMKVELAMLARDQIGALYGRITRGVDGLVRFMRIGFLDSVPALLTGTFALGAALSKQPRIALAMAGVIPVSLGLTVWQLITQNGVRRDLLKSRELIDGTVTEQLGGMDYIRAADTHSGEIRRVEQVAEHRRAKEFRHQFEMSLFGSAKAINEGFFHLVVLATAIYLLESGRLAAGDILTFSFLYLSVMAPLNEVHRFVDEAHESSLRAGDLLELLDLPIDRSFEPTDEREPRLEVGEPLFVAEDLRVTFPSTLGPSNTRTQWTFGHDQAWRDDWCCRAFRLRQDHLASYAHATSARKWRGRDTRGCTSLRRFAPRHRQSWSAMSARIPSFSPERLKRISPMAARQRPMIRSDSRLSWHTFITRS